MIFDKAHFVIPMHFAPFGQKQPFVFIDVLNYNKEYCCFFVSKNDSF